MKHVRFCNLFVVAIFVSALGSLSVVFAEPSKSDFGLRPYKTIELEEGTPLYELMDREGGIADAMDSDSKHKVVIAGYDVVQLQRKEFNPEVFEKLMPLFREGEEGFKNLIEMLAGSKHNVITIVPAIAKVLQDENLLKSPSKVGLAATRLAPVIMMSSGSGTAIPLTHDVNTYHYGYKSGDDTPGAENPEVNRKRTKSGRSYIDLPNRRSHDPSDVYFLNETTKLLGRLKNPWPLYRVMFSILTEGDASGIDKLSKNAKTVLADWFGIYIAEQRRHRMTGWTRMDWENAISELLMIAPYTLKANQIRNRDGEIVDGNLVDYFGVGSQGSGLGGLAGIERRRYTRMVSKIMAELHPEEHAALAGLIGARKGADLCSGVMKFLNNGRNQPQVRANAREIAKATVDYLRAMRESASEIASRLGGK